MNSGSWKSFWITTPSRITPTQTTLTLARVSMNRRRNILVCTAATCESRRLIIKASLARGYSTDAPEVYEAGEGVPTQIRPGIYKVRRLTVSEVAILKAPHRFPDEPQRHRRRPGGHQHPAANQQALSRQA